jgi:hypothetical protein
VRALSSVTAHTSASSRSGERAGGKARHAEVAQLIVQSDIWEKTTGCVLQAHPEIEISLVA